MEYDPILNYRRVFLDEMGALREAAIRAESESEHEDYEDIGPEIYNDDGEDF